MATLADVARHAGVAASTVSYVLSGKRPVSEETRERVAQSIKLLGYQPHAGAHTKVVRRLLQVLGQGFFDAKWR